MCDDNYVDCPGEEHELDNHFNPATEGPYGPGYHYCNLCDNEGQITKEEYLQWERDQIVNRLS